MSPSLRRHVAPPEAPEAPEAPDVSDVSASFLFAGDRFWLDFVNTDDAVRGMRVDALGDFEMFARWLEASGMVDGERTLGLVRRAELQRAGATAALADARRVRAALRRLAERGAAGIGADAIRDEALGEMNRVLGRSAGMRRVERRGDGAFVRVFVPTGDAFAGLMIPVVDSAADALILGELPRVRRCASARCARMFLDATKNGRRRWCDMSTCGNRAKAERFRTKGLGTRD